MKEHSLFPVAIIVVAFLVMGCNDDSTNESPNASLILEPSIAWIYDNATLLTGPEITFNASGSSDPDGEIRNYHFDFGEENSTDQR